MFYMPYRFHTGIWTHYKSRLLCWMPHVKLSLVFPGVHWISSDIMFLALLFGCFIALQRSNHQSVKACIAVTYQGCNSYEWAEVKEEESGICGKQTQYATWQPKLMWDSEAADTKRLDWLVNQLYLTFINTQDQGDPGRLLIMCKCNLEQWFPIPVLRTTALHIFYVFLTSLHTGIRLSAR